MKTLEVTTTSVATTKTIKITRSKLHQMLRELGVDLGAPNDVSIVFSVPGGGDWSNEKVELDDDERVVTVSWTSTLVGSVRAPTVAPPFTEAEEAPINALNVRAANAARFLKNSARFEGLEVTVILRNLNQREDDETGGIGASGSLDNIVNIMNRSLGVAAEHRRHAWQADDIEKNPDDDIRWLGDIATFCEDLVFHAKRLRCSLRGIFNDVPILAVPYSDPKKLMNLYWTSQTGSRTR